MILHMTPISTVIMPTPAVPVTEEMGELDVVLDGAGENFAMVLVVDVGGGFTVEAVAGPGDEGGVGAVVACTDVFGPGLGIELEDAGAGGGNEADVGEEGAGTVGPDEAGSDGLTGPYPGRLDGDGWDGLRGDEEAATVDDDGGVVDVDEEEVETGSGTGAEVPYSNVGPAEDDDVGIDDGESEDATTEEEPRGVVPVSS
jgi:hypothetical protein